MLVYMRVTLDYMASKGLAPNISEDDLVRQNRCPGIEGYYGQYVVVTKK